MTIFRDNATGAAAIAVDVTAPVSGEQQVLRYLKSVTLHLSAAPTTSESFTITKKPYDTATGGTTEYDTLVLSEDLSVSSVTDLVYEPARPIMLIKGDVWTIAYANTDTGTYGLEIVTSDMEV